MWAEASSAWPAARSTAAAAVSIARIGVIGQRDGCELAVDALELAPCGVDLGQPGLEPVGLVAVGQPLDDAAGGVDAGLRLPQRAARASSAAASAASCTSAAVVSSSRASCRCGLQFGDRGRALVDVGTQPSPLGERGDGRGVGGIRGRGDHLGLLELLGQRGDRLGRGSGRRPGAWPPRPARRRAATGRR